MFAYLFRCYKTASGNHCCNLINFLILLQQLKVTKPQAVITVATEAWLKAQQEKEKARVTKPQAVITVATVIAAIFFMSEPFVLQNRKR